MEKLTKAELKIWARIFAEACPEQISFSLDLNETLTAQQLADRLRTLDPKLADRVLAWHTATVDLGKYVRDRLDIVRTPLLVNEDILMVRQNRSEV